MSTKNFPFAVKAIADYVPTNAGSELRLVTGQIYEVLADDGKGVWYQSCVGGVTGWFPANYTEIVETVSPGKEDLPKPPSTQKPLKDSRGKTKSKSSKSKKSKSSSKKTTKPPIPLKSYVEKNKKNLPCTLNIQVVEAKSLRAVKGDVNKSKTSAHVFIKDVISGEERKIGSTDAKKKTLSPRWNYLFKAVVREAESESVVVKLCQGESYDKKNVIGECTLQLRSSERDFDSPTYQYKWYPIILVGDQANAEIRLYLEFFDTRQTSAPSDFQHISHIGWTKENGFDVENIPQEWKELFKEVGITKGQLRDKDFAETVYNIIQENTEIHNTSPPPPPPINTSPNIDSMPAPPPPPPTPKPVVANPTDSLQDQQNVEPSDSGNDLLSSIRKGTTLNKVEVDTPHPTQTSEASAGGLADMLKKAMDSHRKVVSDDVEDDDWSEEDDWSDD